MVPKGLTKVSGDWRWTYADGNRWVVFCRVPEEPKSWEYRVYELGKLLKISRDIYGTLKEAFSDAMDDLDSFSILMKRMRKN
jgi:hypothetical protein